MTQYLEIKKLFEENQNKEKAIKMAAYMRNQFSFYGLQTTERRNIYKDFLKQEKKSKIVDWKFLDQCWADKHREFQYFVLDYLSAMQHFLTYDDIPKLEWSKDNDFWVRRIAIDHQLCRKEKTNPELLEKILINNFGSSEFFINKAMGWSLRDYSKTNAEWVRNFIEKHKGKMDKLSIREASKYL